MTEDIRIIEVKQSVFADNDADAEELRRQLQEEGTVLLNMMASPGAGKTTILKKLAKEFEGELRFAVMEADIDSDVDARAIQEAGVDAIQIHTGGMCHLDADMTRQGLKELNSAAYDLVILENVGNLVCPAEFDTGAAANITVLSVPEGDDKPLKYPLMYETCQLLVVISTLTAKSFVNMQKGGIRRLRSCLLPPKRGKASRRSPGGSGTGFLIFCLSKTVHLRYTWDDGRNPAAGSQQTHRFTGEGVRHVQKAGKPGKRSADRKRNDAGRPGEEGQGSYGIGHQQD